MKHFSLKGLWLLSLFFVALITSLTAIAAEQAPREVLNEYRLIDEGIEFPDTITLLSALPQS